MKVIDIEKWGSHKTEVYGCLYQESKKAFAENHFDLVEDQYDIFGDILVGLYMNENERHVGIMFPIQFEDSGADVYLQETCPEADLIDFLDQLQLDLDDLFWARDDLDFSNCRTYDLWRQDDNGNSFLVTSFSTKSKAQKHQREYEQKKHKQMYWIEESQ